MSSEVGSRPPGAAIAGLALLGTGVALIALILLLERFISEDTRAIVGCLALVLVVLATVFSGTAWRSQLGKVVCLLASALLLMVLLFAMVSSSSDQTPSPAGGNGRGPGNAAGGPKG